MSKNRHEGRVAYAKGEAEESQESQFTGYWKQFGFKGQPPKSDTPAKKRLEDKCREYTHMVLDMQLRGAMGQDRRRELHNEIAIMVLGKDRDKMDYATAEKISDFASLVITGMVLGQALEEYDKHRE